jgi:pyruvate dehydrogenase E1 component alpha subunit
MEKRGLWGPEREEEARGKAKAAIDEAVKKEESVPPPSPRDIFTYTYQNLTRRQKKQLEEAGWQ